MFKMKECKVLIVDNHQIAADTTKMVLELHGFHDVKVAYSSVDVEAMLKNGYKPDVVVTELSLPIESGYELAISIRRHNKACKLVAVTCQGRKEDKEKTLNAGFDFHLVKPVDPQLLEKIVRQECHDVNHCPLVH
jgi:CheY-like chemotaxis protein